MTNQRILSGLTKVYIKDTEENYGEVNNPERFITNPVVFFQQVLAFWILSHFYPPTVCLIIYGDHVQFFSG